MVFQELPLCNTPTLSNFHCFAKATISGAADARPSLWPLATSIANELKVAMQAKADAVGFATAMDVGCL